MLDAAEQATESTELTVPPMQDALAVFTTEGAIDPWLQKVRRAIDTFDADVNTTAGRKAIASFARRVSNYKTELEAVGKDLADAQKEIPKKIDACRRYLKDRLDEMRDEVRAPLTEWEEREKARVDGHTAAVGALATMASGASTMLEAAKLHEMLAKIEAVPLTEAACEEFLDEYRMVHKQAIERVTAALTARVKQDADQAELAKLRAEQAEREARQRQEQEAKAAKERDAKIAAEAAEKARLDAEAKAEAARLALEKQAADAKAAAEKAERDRLAAEERARVAEEEAVKRVKREAAEQAEREAAAERARLADIDHRAKINRAALDAFVEAGLPQETARQVVTLIAGGKIPAVTIKY